MNILQAITQLKANKQVKSELNVFEPSGTILFQLFAVRDMQNWGVDFEKNDGYCIELAFTSGKPFNKENFQKFKHSKYIESFRQYDKLGLQSYFFFFNEELTPNEINQEIIEIICTVYGDNIQFNLVYNRY